MSLHLPQLKAGPAGVCESGFQLQLRGVFCDPAGPSSTINPTLLTPTPSRAPTSKNPHTAHHSKLDFQPQLSTEQCIPEPCTGYIKALLLAQVVIFGCVTIEFIFLPSTVCIVLQDESKNLCSLAFLAIQDIFVSRGIIVVEQPQLGLVWMS